MAKCCTGGWWDSTALRQFSPALGCIKMDSELIRNTRKRWLFSLFEFAHIEFQERLWILADYPKSVGDFPEAICQYFNDLSLEEGYGDFISEKVISSIELDIIKDFHCVLEEYVEKQVKKSLSDNKILIDPEWMNICVMAKSNWGKLKLIINNVAEVKYMHSLETEYLNDKC